VYARPDEGKGRSPYREWARTLAFSYAEKMCHLADVRAAVGALTE
jgi:hypothetical protein